MSARYIEARFEFVESLLTGTEPGDAALRIGYRYGPGTREDVETWYTEDGYLWLS